jgi:hypothetical protein
VLIIVPVAFIIVPDAFRVVFAAANGLRAAARIGERVMRFLSFRGKRSLIRYPSARVDKRLHG